MQVQIDWNTNTIVAYGDFLVKPDSDPNPIYDAPDDYSPESYSWTPSVPNVYDINDFNLLVKFTKEDLNNRRLKLIDINYYMSNQVSNAQFTTWLTDTRNQQTDYGRGSTSLITFMNNTFPTKAYYTAQRQSDILNILNS